MDNLYTNVNNEAQRSLNHPPLNRSQSDIILIWDRLPPVDIQTPSDSIWLSSGEIMDKMGGPRRGGFADWIKKDITYLHESDYLLKEDDKYRPSDLGVEWLMNLRD